MLRAPACATTAIIQGTTLTSHLFIYHVTCFIYLSRGTFKRVRRLHSLLSFHDVLKLLSPRAASCGQLHVAMSKCSAYQDLTYHNYLLFVIYATTFAREQFVFPSTLRASNGSSRSTRDRCENCILALINLYLT